MVVVVVGAGSGRRSAQAPGEAPCKALVVYRDGWGHHRCCQGRPPAAAGAGAAQLGHDLDSTAAAYSAAARAASWSRPALPPHPPLRTPFSHPRPAPRTLSLSTTAPASGRLPSSLSPASLPRPTHGRCVSRRPGRRSRLSSWRIGSEEPQTATSGSHLPNNTSARQSGSRRRPRAQQAPQLPSGLSSSAPSSVFSTSRDAVRAASPARAVVVAR